MKCRPYPAYKDSGIEWLGDVPEHWRIYRIKHTTYVKGRIGWQGLRFDEFTEEGPYLVTGTDFTNGEINWRSCYYIPEERYREDPHIQLREDDLLITKDGTIGKIAIVKNMPGPASLNSGIFVTRSANPVYTTRYMFWVLSSGVFNGFMESKKAGTTIAHLYQNVFVEFGYPAPTINEQHFIADFLDRETSKLDTLLAKKRTLIEKLKEKRTALISRTVTRGLPPEAARAAELKPHPKLKASSVEWLGEVPEHWKVTRLKHAAAKIVDCPHETPIYSPDGDYTVIRTADLTSGSVNLSAAYRIDEDEYRKRIRRECVFESDIVYGREGERWGFAALVPPSPSVCLGQRMMQFRAAAHFDARFLMWQLNAGSVYNQGAVDTMGATSPHVNVQTIRNYWLTEPPPREQCAIADFLDYETAKIDHLIEKVQAAIEKLQEYRTALITAAVTGKIDVRGLTLREWTT